MKLVQISVTNFRLLKQASIRLDSHGATTILVGPNNSGKTSVAEALLLFASSGSKRFSVYDFSVDCRAAFEKAQARIIDNSNVATLKELLPSMSMELEFEYGDDGADLAVAADLMMDLDPESRRVALRIVYAVKDGPVLGQEFRERRKEGETLFDFLLAQLVSHYELSYFKVAPGSDEAERLDSDAVLKRALKVDFVFAQRHIDDQENSRATRLSHLLHDHYERHYKTAEPLSHQAIEQTLKSHADELGGQYMKAFEGLIRNLRQFGYSRRAPSMSIRAELNATTLFKDNTRIYYGTSLGAIAAEAVREDAEAARRASYELPEKYNGLGFKNLIYMILQVQSFRVALEQMAADRPRVHLIFIEEPETHLHPQVQSVFIAQISAFLKGDGRGQDVQVVLTTHSSHIVAGCGFTPVRYFRRKDDHVSIKDLLEFERKLDAPEAIRFLAKYMSQTRCDLFFADKAILVEGQVERLLLPRMIVECADKGRPDFSTEYISVMEVGGAHAHKFEQLLKFIEIPTLIITDLDAVDGKGKACPVADGTGTSNATLRNWLPGKSTLAELRAAGADTKTDGPIRIAYQCSETEASNCGRSFEEAFVYCNAEWLIANRTLMIATGTYFDQATAADLMKDAFGLRLPKVDFALDLLVVEGWRAPLYIAEGLEWLAECEAAQ